MQSEIIINGSVSTVLHTKNETTFLDGQKTEYRLKKIHSSHYLLYQGHKIYDIEVVYQQGLTATLKINGIELETEIKDPLHQLLERLGMTSLHDEQVNELTAPMPGTILEILVKPGQVVKKEEPTIILEAMKMENVIKSPGDGIISDVKVAVGQNVEKNQSLVLF